MNTPIETVWNEMKVRAAENAARGRRPLRTEAESTVIHLMRDAGVSPWPPRSVIEFFASEFVSMVTRAAASRDSAPDGVRPGQMIHRSPPTAR
jgi:hypothetical protein